MDCSNSTAALAVQRADPSGPLRPFVHCYLQRDGHFKELVTVEPVMARLEQAFEFQFRDPYEVALYGSDARDDCPPAIVVGPQTHRRARLILQGTISAFAVMLRPAGFHRLFRLPLHHFVDCGTDAQALLGPSVADLRERLGNAEAFEERVRLMERFLLQRIRPQVDPFAGIVRLMLRRAQAGEGDPWARNKISDVAFQTGWSMRQFERRFLEYTGVSPVVFTRMPDSKQRSGWGDLRHSNHGQRSLTRWGITIRCT
jgi:hypothetical protein